MSKPYIANKEHILKREKLANKCFDLCIEKSFKSKNNPKDSFLRQALRFSNFSIYYSPIFNIRK